MKIYAEKDWKYNGDFHSLNTFNQRVGSELAEKSTLAEKILNGNVKVKEQYIPGELGMIYRQEGRMGGIFSNLMLAIVIVTSADPEGTRKRLGDRFYDEVITDKNAKAKVLFEIIFDAGPIDFENMDAETRETVLNEIEDNFTKVKTLSEDKKEEMINDIIEEETEDEMISRAKIGL